VMAAAAAVMAAAAATAVTKAGSSCIHLPSRCVQGTWWA
jgi:hypothetical protein